MCRDVRDTEMEYPSKYLKRKEKNKQLLLLFFFFFFFIPFSPSRNRFTWKNNIYIWSTHPQFIIKINTHKKKNARQRHPDLCVIYEIQLLIALLLLARGRNIRYIINLKKIYIIYIRMCISIHSAAYGFFFSTLKLLYYYCFVRSCRCGNITRARACVRKLGVIYRDENNNKLLTPSERPCAVSVFVSHISPV